LKLEDYPAVQDQWLKYLIEKWQPWSEQHRRWKSVQALYGSLFTIYNQQKKLGEEYELIVGLGLLNWITPSSQRVRRHVLVAQASISFDAARGIISVQPAADGVKLSLESDMLEPSERPAVEQQLTIESALAAAAETPWDKGLVEPVLQSWVHSIDPLGTYEGSLIPPTETNRAPQIFFSPAVILRRRTARSLVRALSTVIEQIKAGTEIPFGVRRLCEITQDSYAVAESERTSGMDVNEVAVDAEVYFPLATNDEQRSIVDRHRVSQGVLVQGPPGTGKSHTIANLICHLLATGKRVLVTSQTPRALRVLKSKIPPQLSALCVSLLGNDVFAMEELKNSVQGITERYQGWQGSQYAREMIELQKKILALKKRRAEIGRFLREVREQETYRHSVSGGKYTGTACAIAKAVRGAAEVHSWFPDSLAENTDMPLGPSDFQMLLTAYRSLTSDRCAEVVQPVVAFSSLPRLQEFIELVKREAELDARWNLYESRKSRVSYRQLRLATREARQAIDSSLRDLLASLSSVRAHQLPWIPQAITEVLTARDRRWHELHATSVITLEGLLKRAQHAQACSLRYQSVIDPQKLFLDARELHSHLISGGGLGWWVFRKEIVKRTLYLTKDITINGRPCNSAEKIQELIEQVGVRIHINHLWTAWQGIAQPIEGPLPRQVSALEENQEILGRVLSLKDPLGRAKVAVAAIDGLAEPVWHDDESIKDLLADLEAAEAEDLLLEARADLESYLTTVQAVASHPASHPINKLLLKNLQDRDVDGFASTVHELECLEKDRVLLAEREKLTQQLRGVAPKLVASIADSSQDLVWDRRMATIEDSWAWARANAWIRAFQSRANETALENELRRVQVDILDKVANLASVKAWKVCFERMKEEHRQFLIAWAKEVKLVGKGTGRYAEKHRRAAQKYMDRCREAIPAWIMPFYRIAETVEPKPNQFDVIIVDEASQSGPEALWLQYICKQMIIVGDDEQISPDFIGVDQEEVQRLIDRYLFDFDLKDSFGVGHSLFDHGRIRYGSRIVLREHFRCMPEIIRFSNNLCYSATPLVPLREYPPQRLEPIVTHCVPNGFREGGSQSAQNRPEAEAIVEMICQCCTDASYADKTMGVISLQGEYQARLIEKLLRERLQEGEIDQRRLICGDAYAFQGDERDIIFLSMVAAPNETIGALTKDADKRRFNVAASRARDQAWLFHTATLNDMNPQDMRYKLLAHYLNPASDVGGAPDWSTCESGFEVDVGKLIQARGYRVLVQYEPLGPSNKRIDLVVEGTKSRLAVECDGDYWHGPEKYEEDMVRQRQLERCGWKFWRVRGSTFYCDPEAALESLWHELRSLNIYPVGVIPSAQGQDSSGTAPVVIFPTPVDAETRAYHPQTHQITLLQEKEPSIEDDDSADSSGDVTQDELFNREESPRSLGGDIDDIPQEMVRSALEAYLPLRGTIDREVLLRKAAHHLGFSKIGRKIRTRLNRAIGAEVRAGRVQSAWQLVWRPGSGNKELSTGS
jgi:very-short-patch-repair endonuclease